MNTFCKALFILTLTLWIFPSAGQNKKLQGEYDTSPVRILIENFKISTDDKLYSDLGIKIPMLIELNLRSRYYQVTLDGDEKAVTNFERSKTNSDFDNSMLTQWQEELSTIQRQKYIKEEYKYIVRGKVNVLADEISFSSTVYCLTKDTSFNYKPQEKFSPVELFRQVEYMVKNTKSFITSTHQSARIQIAFTSFKPDKGKPVPETADQATESITGLSYKLSNQQSPLYFFTSFRNTPDGIRNFNDEKQLFIQASKDKYSIVIGGIYHFTKKEHWISPKLFFIAQQRVVDLPKIEQTENDPVPMDKKLSYEITSALNSFVDSTGEIQIQDAPAGKLSMKEYIEKAKKFEKKDPYLHSLYLRLAYESDEYGNKKDFGVCLDLGNMKVAQGSYVNGIELLKEAKKLQPQNIQVVLSLGFAYFMSGNFSESINYYHKAEELNKDYYGLSKNIGIVYFYMDSLNKSEAYLMKALKEQNPSEYSYLYLGKISQGRNEYENAIRYYNNALVINPKNDDVIEQINSFYVERGDNFSNLESYDSALVNYQKAKNIYKSDETYNRVLIVYDIQKNFAAAHAFVEEGIRDGIYKPGTAYYDHADFLRAVSANSLPQDPVLLREAVNTLFRQKEVNKSYSEAILRLLGICYFEMKQLDSAMFYYKFALKINPENPSNSLNLAEVQVLLSMKDKSQIENAKATLEKFTVGSHEDDGYAAVSLFLKLALGTIWNTYPQNQIKADEELLNSLMDQGTVLIPWSFDAFEVWLNSPECNTSPENKKYISSWITAMRNKNSD